ncbi:hypothetical protein, partial [Enterobacter kobei]
WIVPPKSNSSQKEMIRLQGKHNMMEDEKGRVEPWRPYQLMLELVHPQFPDKKDLFSQAPFVMTQPTSH